MGRGIVQLLAQAASVASIVWIGRSAMNCDAALTSVTQQLDKLVIRGRLSADDALSVKQKIAISRGYEDLIECDFILEAVSENFEHKEAVFQAISQYVGPDTIIASNTSSMSITQLAALLPYCENVVGLHFFNPAPVMKLTEVINGLTTSAKTTESAIEFARSLGKDPVTVNEAPGFIVNRMLIPMINEAIGILAEGVATAEEIDKAMRLGANHPLGPLALADLIGNDVNLSIMETLHSETGDPKYRAHPLLRKMVRANKLGRKTGAGFFNYQKDPQ